MRIYITAHRGMGITAKNRSEFIAGARFFPENSIAAFKEAIEIGADALECDIHVSKDNVAMVIHGSKVTDYAYYIADKADSFESDENKTCERYTREQLQHDFALKTFEGINLKDPDWQIKSVERRQYYNEQLLREPDFYQIPTLLQLLELLAQNNEKRTLVGKEPLKLNIELKGKNSGFVTLCTIIEFAKRNKLDCSDIILLGRIDVGEITIAKSILRNAAQCLGDEPTSSFKPEILLAEDEFKVFYLRKGWKIALTSIPLAEMIQYNEKDFPDDFPKEKMVILTNDNHVLFARSKRFLKKGSPSPVFFKVEMKEGGLPVLAANTESRFLIIDPYTKGLEPILYKLLSLADFNPYYYEIPQEYTTGKILERLCEYVAPTEPGKKPIDANKLKLYLKYFLKLLSLML